MGTTVPDMSNLSPEIVRRAAPVELRASVLLGSDVVAWLEKRHDDGATWEEARDQLADLTGVRVSVRTLINWRMARAA